MLTATYMFGFCIISTFVLCENNAKCKYNNIEIYMEINGV